MRHTPSSSDGSWSPEGVILFDGRVTDPLMRVAASGGVAQPVVFEPGKEKDSPGSGWPEFLPDGKHFLYTIVDPASPEMMLAVGSIETPLSKPLFKTTTQVQYAAPGYLLFVRVFSRFTFKSRRNWRRYGRQTAVASSTPRRLKEPAIFT